MKNVVAEASKHFSSQNNQIELFEESYRKIDKVYGGYIKVVRNR